MNKTQHSLTTDFNGNTYCRVCGLDAKAIRALAAKRDLTNK